MHLQSPKPAQKLLPPLLGMLAGIAGALIPAALLLVPATWAYAMCKTKPVSLALFGGVFAVLEILLLGTFSGACIAALCIGMAAALYYLQTKKIGNAYTVATASGVALLGLYALVCMPGILSGEGAFTAAQQLISESAEAFRALVTATGAVPAADMNTFLEAIDFYVESLPDMIVSALCILSGVLGLANFLFFRLFARGKQLSITPLRPFREWSIPRNLTTGLVMMLIGSLIMGFTGWDYAAALSNTVNAIVGMPLLLQGLCVLDFLLARKNDGKVATRRVLAYLLSGTLLFVALTPLIMLGCFDQVFRFRMRVTTPPAA